MHLWQVKVGNTILKEKSSRVVSVTGVAPKREMVSCGRVFRFFGDEVKFCKALQVLSGIKGCFWFT